MVETMIEEDPIARDARREAAAMLGPDSFGLVLEPSPPAVVDGDWFADDPLDPAGAPDGTEIVWPFASATAGSGVGRTWSDVSMADEDLARWAEARWLGPFPSLEPLPGSYEPTRLALHQVCVYVMSAVRREANGKIALRYTHRGFGTPFFVRNGRDVQVRVERGLLVVQEDSDVRIAEVSSLAAAGELVGVEVDREAASHVGGDGPAIDEGALDVDRAAAEALGAWYGFTCSVLEELRAEVGIGSVEGAPALPSRLQLWPEHFDVAFVAGDPDACTQANYGGSPGDAGSPEPYLYVGPFDRDGLDDPYWNAAFGSRLTYAEILRTEDQRATALRFLREGRDRLATRAAKG